MAGAFDDLIPGTQAPAQATMQGAPMGMFDDLIPKGSSDDPSYTTSIAREFGTGAPVVGGLLNRADAALGAVPMPFYGPTGSQKPTFAERYQENLDEQNAMDKKFETENPVASKAANIAGAVGATIPLGATALGGRALGLEGSLPGRMIQGSLGGAAIGGTDAAVRGESPEGGALAGAAFGGFAPALGAAAGKAVSWVGEQLAPPLASMADLNSPARRMLLKSFQDATPEAIAAGQQRVGPHGFLGDITPELTDLTGSVGDSTGPGKGIVRDAYGVRDTNPPPVSGNMGPTTGPRTRIEQALTEAFGPRTNVVQSTIADKAARAANADPLYEAWRSTAVPMTPELSTIAQLPSVRGAMSSAQKMAADEGQQFVDAQGNPTAQTWDYIKQAMDDRAKTAGYGTNEARIAKGISQRIIGAIDNHPDPNVAGVWQRARQAWASPTAAMDAQEYGQSLFSKSMSADQVAHDLAPMSGPERAAVAEGSRAQVQQLMDASTRGDTQARNILLAPANQQKLAQVVGQPKADALLQSLQHEAELKAQNQNVVGGSQTTPKAARLALTAPPSTDTGWLGWWNKFSPVDKPSTIIPQLRGEFQNDQYSAARAQIAPLLTTPGSDRDALIEQLMRGSGIDASNSARAKNVRDLATMLMSGAGSEEGRRAIAPQNLRLFRQ